MGLDRDFLQMATRVAGEERRRAQAAQAELEAAAAPLLIILDSLAALGADAAGRRLAHRRSIARGALTVTACYGAEDVALTGEASDPESTLTLVIGAERPRAIFRPEGEDIPLVHVADSPAELRPALARWVGQHMPHRLAEMEELVARTESEVPGAGGGD